MLQNPKSTLSKKLRPRCSKMDNTKLLSQLDIFVPQMRYIVQRDKVQGCYGKGEPGHQVIKGVISASPTNIENGFHTEQLNTRVIDLREMLMGRTTSHLPWLRKTYHQNHSWMMATQHC